MSVSISFSEMIACDPVLSMMDNPNILWGDLLRESLPPTPNLSKRKSIENHYPVLVRLQPSKALGIQWRMSTLAEWRTEHPNPLDWKPYEVKNAREMIRGLQHSGWNVSAPTHPSFICSITRNQQNSSLSSSWVYEEPDCPTLLCLNDIKLFFPVIWHKLESNCKTYSLELYHDKIRATAVSRRVLPELLTNHLSSLLMTTLEQSPAWNVVQSQMTGEYCRLVVV